MKNTLSAFSLLIILFSSCTRYITPPITGQNNIGYIPRPFYKDLTASKIYISGGYETAQSRDGHLAFYMGNFNINRGHAIKNFNFGYGVFASFGKAVFKDTSNNRNFPNEPSLPNFNKNLNNIGLRTTIGYHKISDNGKTNFRFINWENAFSIENGDYADYRAEIYKTDVSGAPNSIYVTNQQRFFTTGLSTEILKKDGFGVKDLETSLRFFLGYTTNMRNKYVNITSRNSTINSSGGCVVASYFIKYKGIFTSLELGTDVNIGAKILLGYSF